MCAAFRRIVIASTNKGKLREIARRFAEIGVDAVSLADFPPLPPVVEDGDTFAANAAKKARSVAAALGMPALADDSGLCVDALGGKPGVRSARFAGENATDADNIARLLDELRGISATGGFGVAKPELPPPFRPLSPASFVCALALCVPAAGRLLAAEGKCDGWIIAAPRGENGFGYDPVFYLPEFGKTMAELDVARKNAISHRGRALEKLLSLISP